MLAILTIIKNYLLGLAKAQVIVSLVSLPILISWGIPFSLMAFFGNLLFTPILTIFLILSSLTFFTELLHIPNGILITALDQTTSFWQVILSYGEKAWLIGIAQPGKTITVLLIALVFFLTLRFIFRILSKVIIIGLVLIGTYAIVEMIRNPQKFKTNVTVVTPFTKKKMNLVERTDGTIDIIDNGLFNSKQSPENFVSFELRPYIIKRYGTTTINKLILNKPSKRSILGMKKLCETFLIKEVVIAQTKKRSLAKSIERSLLTLRELLSAQGTLLSKREP